MMDLDGYTIRLITSTYIITLRFMMGLYKDIGDLFGGVYSCGQE